ncbi:MAG: IS110 family transposase [Roseiflexus sp.]
MSEFCRRSSSLASLLWACFQAHTWVLIDWGLANDGLWDLTGEAGIQGATWNQTIYSVSRAQKDCKNDVTAFQTAVSQTTVPPSATLVALEATGSYWITLAVTLHQAGYAVSLVNPSHAHAFARSLPQRARTDAFDAQPLAPFAAKCQPPRWTPPKQVYHELRQRLLVRDGLLTIRQQARNRCHALAQWPVRIAGALDHLDAVIADLDTRIATLEGKMATVLRDGAWAESAALIESITGIGLVTTAWLPVATLNFAACASAEGASDYAGLAPLTHESGTSVRGRATIGYGGHACLRTALYLATLTAARFDPVIRAQYERLRADNRRTDLSHDVTRSLGENHSWVAERTEEGGVCPKSGRNLALAWLDCAKVQCYTYRVQANAELYSSVFLAVSGS